MRKIREIRFPNTVNDSDQVCYSVDHSCDEILEITKNGELASVGWFQIIKDGEVIAEIKESVCDIFITYK